MTLRARFEVLLRHVEQIPTRALPRAAERVQTRLRADATTGRGNVPGFGEMGGPIVAAATGDGVAVKAPGWVHDIAAREGQPDTWIEDVADEVRRAIEEDS